MAWLNNSSVSTGKCQIRLTEPIQRKVSESGQDMEDSGVHLEESPTNFGFESKVMMTYPPCGTPSHAVSSASSLAPSPDWSTVTIVRSTDSRLREEVDDNNEDKEKEEAEEKHNNLVSQTMTTTTRTRVTMTSLTVGYRGDGGVTIGRHGDDVTIGRHGGGVTIGRHGDDVTIGRHGDGATTVQRLVQSTSLTAPPRLKQSLSASEGVNLLPGGLEVIIGGGGRRAGERRRDDVFLSAPEATAERRDVAVGGQGGGQGGGGSGMTKLQKFFEPLRRSRSTGNAKTEETTKEESMPQQQQQQGSGFGPYLFKTSSSSKKEDRLSADTGNGSMESELDRDSEDRVDRGKARNLSSEVKERFSIFLRHHHTDPTLTFREGGRREKITLEAVLNWAKSFENLLADKNGLHWFREFLKSEFSEENIEFWIACEDYKHLKPNKMAAQAQKIFTQFVIQQAPREINIDSRTRDLTYENLRHPESSTFEAAQKRIESLMGKDSYPRFIESDLYLRLLSGLKS